jgi:hypothetical protein
VTFTNTGTAALTLAVPVVTGAGVSLVAPVIADGTVLAPGAQVTQALEFVPAAEGPLTSGVLSLGASELTLPVVVALSGNGVPVPPPVVSMSVAPTAVDFGDVVVGQSAAGSVTFTNTGTAALTLAVPVVTGAGVSLVAPVIADGTVLAPGADVTQALEFAPAVEGPMTGELSLSVAEILAPVVVALSGDGVPVPPPVVSMSASPLSVDFGDVVVGQSAAGSVTFTNDGEAPLTLAAPTVSGAGIALTAPVITVGTVLAPGAQVTQALEFAPTAEGLVVGELTLSAAELGSPVVVALSGEGVADSPPTGACGTSIVGGFGAAGWTYAGTAAVVDTELVLNEATTFSTGAGFWMTPMSPVGLEICFEALLGPGTGADGLTLAFLDAALAPNGGVGGIGGGLGLAGLPGVAVTLDTFANAGEPSANFVGVVTSVAGAGELVLLDSSTVVPDLRAGPVAVKVAVVAGPRLVVTVEDVEVLDVAVPTLAASTLVGFTASTGSTADRHAIESLTVVQSSGPSSFTATQDPGSGSGVAMVLPLPLLALAWIRRPARRWWIGESLFDVTRRDGGSRLRRGRRSRSTPRG